MDNVTKIKFQYFKPLEKGTEKREAGGSVGLPRGRSAGQGVGTGGQEGAGHIGGGGACREARPSPAAGSDARTPGRRVWGHREHASALRVLSPRTAPSASAAGCGIPEIRRVPLRHRDPHAPAAASPGTSFSSGSTREKPQHANERAPSS